ncbi:hypothetical protein CYY_001708 [Polysphondylium violaceum]|uniref:Transcription factor IIIC-epsilon subunit n=1 Tax=Polysphondylium violaceum TaxID=133409 RepID=A0A8J4Q1D3_9MYCE|nr:hypothetical protein CYY_001708 [Polysphondylium violaceum]
MEDVADSNSTPLIEKSNDEKVNDSNDTSTRMNIDNNKDGHNNKDSSSNNNDTSMTMVIEDDESNKQQQQQQQQQNDNKSLISSNFVFYQKAPIKPLPTTVYYGLEYPANVQNADKAIENVGGLSRIAKVVRSSEKECLQLKFRQNNSSAKPAYGTKVPTCHLLLRVRKNNMVVDNDIVSSGNVVNNSNGVENDTSNGNNGSGVNTPPHPKESFSAAIIALVPSTIQFDGLCDFQYSIHGQKVQKQEQEEAQVAADAAAEVEEDFQKNKREQFEQERLQQKQSKTSKETLVDNNDNNNNSNKEQPENTETTATAATTTTSDKPIEKDTDQEMSDIAVEKEQDGDESMTGKEKPSRQGENDENNNNNNNNNNKTKENKATSRSKGKKQNDTVTTTNENHDTILTKDEPLNLLPPIFSKIDYPQPYLFKVNPHSTWDQSTKQFRVPRSSYHKTVTILTYYDDVPSKPISRLPENYTNDNTMKRTVDIIVELFENRPIWLLIVIFDEIQKRGGNIQHAKRILPHLAFNYSNGPWRRCWVKWGYDPKLDPDSSVFQIVDFRIDHNISSANNQSVKPIVVNPWRKKSKVINTYEFQTEKKLLTGSTTYAPPEYDYTFKEAPSKHNTLYQICDIDDPKIKEFFSKEQIQPSCTLKSGWYGAKTFREAYVIMKRKLGLIDNRMRFNKTESEVKGEDEITLMLTDKVEDESDRGGVLMRDDLERMEDDMNYVEGHEPFKIYDDDTGNDDGDEDDIRAQMATIFGDGDDEDDDLGLDEEDDDEDDDEEEEEEEEEEDDDESN